MGWFDWLGLSENTQPDRSTRTEVVARIAAKLQSLPPDRARLVAAFAYHLGRIAHADHHLTDDERAVMHSLIAGESGLPDDQVTLVVDMVAELSLKLRGTEDYLVMREFDDLATPDEKLALVRCLFAVSAADARVVMREDNEIRRIAIALKISHEDFVAARATVRQHLAVLQKPDVSGTA